MRQVHKFGGGILSNAGDFRRAAALVSQSVRTGDELACVVSAVAGVTDALRAAAADAKTGKNLQSAQRLEAVVAQQEAIAGVLSPQVRPPVLSSLHAITGECGKHLEKPAGDGFADRIECAGERMASVLFAGFLSEQGIPSKPFDASEAGIAARGRFQNACAQLEHTEANLRERIVPAMEKGIVPVITGYYGILADGEPATFGRGGSDYSAAIVAAGIGAQALVLWKDVPGFMTADPKRINHAQLVPQLSYREATELGFFGAKILHPRTITPLQKLGIPIVIRSILQPESRGTVVSPETNSGGVKSIASKTGIAVITARGTHAAEAPGMASSVFFALMRENVNVDVIVTSQTSIAFTVDSLQAGMACKALEGVGSLDSVSCESHLAVLSLIGSQLNVHPHVAARALRSLTEAGISLKLGVMDSLGVNFSVVVEEKELQKGMENFHHLLFEEPITLREVRE